MEVGVVVYPGVQHAAVLGLTDLFEMANRQAISRRDDGGPMLRVTHWKQGAQGDLTSVFDSCPEAGASQPSALILPPSLNDPARADAFPTLLSWLRESHAQGVMLTSVCAGAFLLAATGLMAGRRMTTHWSYAELLQERYPDIRVDADRLLIDDGDIISAGDRGAGRITGLYGCGVGAGRAYVSAAFPEGHRNEND